MNDEEIKCCGNCIWHEFEGIDEGYMCTNPDSNYIADYTDDDHVCYDWEG